MKEEKNGVWRTIRGRRIFIEYGEDLASAMKKSGKFEGEKNTGKSTRAEVVDKIQRHISEYYENDEDLVRDMDAAADPRYDKTPWQKGERLVEGGNFLIADEDMNDTLNSWGINPQGKKFSEEKSYSTYKSLMGRELGKRYEKYKNSQNFQRNKTPKERAREIDKMNLIKENQELYKQYSGFADTGNKEKNKEVEKAHKKWLENAKKIKGGK